MGLEYYRLTVPKEDESTVLSKEYRVNEHKEMYNKDYEGQRYLDSRGVVVLELDPSIGYKIN